MADNIKISMEDLQIAVDQMDQTIEVMSRLIKQMKHNLHTIEVSPSSFLNSDSRDDLKAVIPDQSQNLH